MHDSTNGPLLLQPRGPAGCAGVHEAPHLAWLPHGVVSRRVSCAWWAATLCTQLHLQTYLGPPHVPHCRSGHSACASTLVEHNKLEFDSSNHVRPARRDQRVAALLWAASYLRTITACYRPRRAFAGPSLLLHSAPEGSRSTKDVVAGWAAGSLSRCGLILQPLQLVRWVAAGQRGSLGGAGNGSGGSTSAGEPPRGTSSGGAAAAGAGTARPLSATAVLSSGTESAAASQGGSSSGGGTNAVAVAMAAQLELELERVSG